MEEGKHQKMKLFGVALVVLGSLALLYGGISYSRQRTVVDMGPLKATATEQKNIPIPPIVGAIALMAGIVVLAMPKKSVA